MQHDDSEDTELGELLLLLRELVSEGTSEPLSESDSDSLSSESLKSVAARRALSASMLGFMKRSCTTCRVACGLVGKGDWICDGERERPLGTWTELRRECPLDVEVEKRLDVRSLPVSGWLLEKGMSRMFSFRPVVGSTTDSLAGSCET